MRWILRDMPAGAKETAAVHNISPITAAVLLNRGLCSNDEIDEYLNSSSKNLSDTSAINDYAKGLEILKLSLDNNEKIYIYGDYDVDGVMSTSILYKALKALGADVRYYLPHRIYDGYGLNPEAVRKIHSNGCRLLITCDNGIAALSETALAKESGMKVVILDHHEPVIENDRQILPDADAVIDCKRTDCTFPFREMCAAGLCYRFVKDLYKFIGKKFTLDRELVTLAGIATVCDIVELRRDNRIFVKLALYLLENDIRGIGLRYLAAMTVPQGKEITAYTLGFIIGPCINAMGRLETASEATELFITEDEEKARELAIRLTEKNKERKEMTAAASEKLAQQVDPTLPVQVLYSPDIHESIAGIIASRIKEKFYRPTLVITNAAEGCKGSGRSIEGYDMHKELSAVSELFTKFGGHSMAVGFSLPYENINKLRDALNASCKLSAEDMQPVLSAECPIALESIDISLAYELRRLEPFGKGNPKPVFYTSAAKIETARLVGAEKTIVQLWFSAKDMPPIKGIFFGGRETVMELLDKNTFALLEDGAAHSIDIAADILYSIEINTYKGKDSVQLNISDMR